MTTEERRWMMLWIVMGRPTTLPVKMFASLPLDAVIDSYDRTDDDMLSFKANGQRHAYTLTWPRYEGPYEALCWRHDQPLQRGKEKTCRGSFPEVMDAIRKWTYAELTRQGRDKAGSGQGRVGTRHEKIVRDPAFPVLTAAGKLV